MSRPRGADVWAGGAMSRAGGPMLGGRAAGLTLPPMPGWAGLGPPNPEWAGLAMGCEGGAGLGAP